jgi:hypothetical protein
MELPSLARAGLPASGPFAAFQIVAVRTPPSLCLPLMAVTHAGTMVLRSGPPDWDPANTLGCSVSKLACLQATTS